VFALRRPLGFLGFGQAKLLLPTFGRLLPECPILCSDREPLKLAAFFNLLSEEILPIKWHGAHLTKKRPSLPRGDLSTFQEEERPVSPSPTPQRDRQILIANCVLARTNPRRLVELVDLLQLSHGPNQSAEHHLG
jgi:hypothetical protein